MPNIPERKLISSERTSERLINIYEATEVDYSYADGTARMILGGQQTKIELFRVTELKSEDHGGLSTQIEEREVFCRLTIPTIALIEAFGVLIDQLSANMRLIDAANQNIKEVLKNAIQKAAAAKV